METYIDRLDGVRRPLRSSTQWQITNEVKRIVDQEARRISELSGRHIGASDLVEKLLRKALGLDQVRSDDLVQW